MLNRLVSDVGKLVMPNLKEAFLCSLKITFDNKPKSLHLRIMHGRETVSCLEVQKGPQVSKARGRRIRNTGNYLLHSLR